MKQTPHNDDCAIGSQEWTVWNHSSVMGDLEALNDHTRAAAQEPEGWKVVTVISLRSGWYVLLEATKNTSSNKYPTCPTGEHSDGCGPADHLGWTIQG